MPQLIHIAAICLVASAGSQPSSSASDPDADKAAMEAEAEESRYRTVTVSRREPEDPFLSDRSVAVRDQEALAESSPRSTPEALFDAPGVFVQKTNHGGGSPIVRGMIGPQVLITVDGVRLNNSVYRSGPLQYLNLVDPLALSQIEVLRGPGSVLYGSDAMGGVVALSTHQPPSPRSLEGGGRLLLRYGSADQQGSIYSHARAGVAGAGVVVGASFKRFEDLDGGRELGVQPYSGYQHSSALARATYQLELGELGRLDLNAGYLMARVADAGRTDKLVDKQSLQIYDNDDDLAYARAGLALWPLRTRVELTLSYQQFFERKDNIAVEEDLATEVSTVRDEIEVHTIGGDLQLATRLLDNRLRFVYGGMWYRDLVGAEQWRRERNQDWRESSVLSYPPGSTYDNLGLFALISGDALRFESGHLLRPSGGYRLHGMRGEAPVRADLPAVEFMHLGHVFSAGLQYLYSDLATVAFTFSQGFRAPNLNEAVMLGDTGKFFHIPNDQLGPERSDTFELLARARLGRLTMSGSGYVSLLHDLIKRDDAEWEGQAEVGNKRVAQNVNGGEGLLWGVDGLVALDIAHGFSVRGHATYTLGDELIEAEESVPLTRIPPLFGQAVLRYDYRENSSWRGFAETYVRGAAMQDRLSAEDEKDARIPEGGTPGWWTWNVRAGVAVQEHLRVTLGVENLLDETYRYHGSGIFAPGSSVILTIQGDL